MKVGDLVLLKTEYQTFDVYYGIGVITMMDEGNYNDTESSQLGETAWKSFRVQWDDDWYWHDINELELVSESR